MKYLILTLLIVAYPSQAFDWPWQDQQHEDYSYCKGFAHSGLASTAVTSVARIQLWLDWNNVVRAQFEKGSLDEARYELGKARFESLLGANDPAAILDAAKDECDFGRDWMS
jgi:hypothetical protein